MGACPARKGKFVIIYISRWGMLRPRWMGSGGGEDVCIYTQDNDTARLIGNAYEHISLLVDLNKNLFLYASRPKIILNFAF